MGCSGSRNSLFKKVKTDSTENQPPPLGNPITVDEQPKRIRSFRGEYGTRRIPDARRVRLADEPDRGYKARYAGELMDQKKIERMIERRQSERLALEAFRADAALSESMYMPEVREIIQMDDNRDAGDGSPGSIDPFAPRGSSIHSMALQQPWQMDASAMSAPYLMDKGRLYPASRATMNTHSSPMLFQDAPPYEIDFRTNPYGNPYPTFMNRNRFEPGNVMQNRYAPGMGMQQTRKYSWAGMPNPGEQNNQNWTANAPRRTSLSFASVPAMAPVVMGRRPDQEDSVSQNQMTQPSGSHRGRKNHDPVALLAEHNDDPFETHGDSKNSSGYSNPPVDPFGTQDADPFGSGSRRHSTYGNQQQNDVTAVVDQTSSKSTETKRSKWGEAPTDIDRGKQPPIKNNEPIFETDPFGMSMSQMLEGVLSDDSESISNRGRTEHNGKATGAEEDNWENLLKGVNASPSSSSTELDVNAIATKMDPIYECSWQNEEQQAVTENDEL